jgi:hypothetical protein
MAPDERGELGFVVSHSSPRRSDEWGTENLWVGPQVDELL